MRSLESKMGLTGNLFEDQSIGVVKTQSPEYQKELAQVRQEEAGQGMKGGYIRFRKAVELAKKFQPYDPTNPNKPFARDLRIEVLDKMIERGWIGETEEDQDRVKFYTASGTPLDTLHSADAFVEFEDKNGKVHRVTFDLTMNPNKRAYKDNIVVHELPDPNLEEELEEYNKTVKDYAEQVIKKIEDKKIDKKS